MESSKIIDPFRNLMPSKVLAIIGRVGSEKMNMFLKENTTTRRRGGISDLKSFLRVMARRPNQMKNHSKSHRTHRFSSRTEIPSKIYVEYLLWKFSFVLVSFIGWYWIILWIRVCSCGNATWMFLCCASSQLLYDFLIFILEKFTTFLHFKKNPWFFCVLSWEENVLKLYFYFCLTIVTVPTRKLNSKQ